jgi:hypothetical protein
MPHLALTLLLGRRNFAGEGYISSEEAARRSGYTIHHIGLLARSGRLQARRVANRWFIDERALDAFVTNRETRSKRGRPRKGLTAR